MPLSSSFAVTSIVALVVPAASSVRAAGVVISTFGGVGSSSSASACATAG
jgi:hypothetical protein